MRRTWIPAAAVAIAVTACSDGRDPNGSQRADEDRPRGSYVVIPGSSMEEGWLEGGSAAAPPRRTIYVNRHGGTYYPGSENAATNRSSIVSQASTVSAYEGSEAQWQSLYACIQDQFSRWNVEVTDQDPGSVPHIEAVVGGWPQQIGMGSGVGGVAPMHEDCSIVERAIVFNFSQVLGSVNTTCEVVAQEVGHAIGMDHEYLCSDPMTYLNGCGKKSFQDQTVSCGEYSPRQCMCSAKQNSVQFMNVRLGPAPGGGGNPTPTPTPAPSPTATPDVDQAAPDVVPLSPANDAVFPRNSTVSVSATITDDVEVASAVLYWYVNGWRAFDCTSPPSGIACSQSGDTYTWTFQVGSGSRWWLVRAKDAAGNRTDSPMRRAYFQ